MAWIIYIATFFTPLQSGNTRKKWNDSCASESNKNNKTNGADLSVIENEIEKVQPKKRELEVFNVQSYLTI